MANKMVLAQKPGQESVETSYAHTTSASKTSLAELLRQVKTVVPLCKKGSWLQHALTRAKDKKQDLQTRKALLRDALERLDDTAERAAASATPNAIKPSGIRKRKRKAVESKKSKASRFQYRAYMGELDMREALPLCSYGNCATPLLEEEENPGLCSDCAREVQHEVPSG